MDSPYTETPPLITDHYQRSNQKTEEGALAKRPNRLWVYDLIVILILIAAALLRFNGLFWGEYQYLHPDERFLIWVGTDISPVNSLSEYFDTANSSLNPHNRGHGFYVYGTLPMFAARYAVEWIFGQTGWQEMTQVGRGLSALADLGMVFLVYLVGRRLYGRRVGTLAIAFAAAAVLQIQQSHFFTMDTFAAFFSFLPFISPSSSQALTQVRQTVWAPMYARSCGRAWALA